VRRRHPRLLGSRAHLPGIQQFLVIHTSVDSLIDALHIYIHAIQLRSIVCKCMFLFDSSLLTLGVVNVVFILFTALILSFRVVLLIMFVYPWCLHILYMIENLIIVRVNFTHHCLFEQFLHKLLHL
jgi:hypothetical protein